MQSFTNLKEGFEILEPFLIHQGFELDLYEDGKSSDGHFTGRIYKNKSKQFTIDYRFSYGQVLYQFDHSIVSHSFYLDQLGFSTEKRLREFLSVDDMQAFNHILFDFEFLVDDFFQGECVKLREFSKIQDGIISQFDKELREENSIQFDTIRIEKARLEFRKKDFKKCVALYNAVEHNNLLSDLDKNIIEFAKQHI